MKKLLLTLGLAAVTLASAHAQGTFQWGNNASTRILVGFDGIETRVATAADGLTFGLYVGPAGSSAEQLVFVSPTAFIGSTPGVLTGAQTVLPGAQPGQTLFMQVRAWDSSGQMLAGPAVRQITFDPATGSATPLWTVDPATRTFFVVPEPSTLALGGLAGAFLLLRARKTFVRR